MVVVGDDTKGRGDTERRGEVVIAADVDSCDEETIVIGAVKETKISVEVPL